MQGGGNEIQTLAKLAGDLAQGRVSAARLVDECLARIDAPEGEGARAFLKVERRAREAAAAMDRLRAAGAAPSPFAGVPISVKDLFDIAGETTTSGSRALADSAPAQADAPAIARLRRAGFIVIGRTNMSEFAFSGVGLNPHYGVPLNPWDRATGRVPGGSSSGAAVSVADGMAHAGIGSDTGGSCRIPAALCGLVGYKPTARLVPLTGAAPLSSSLDSIGPIARSVSCCATLHGFMSGDETPVAGADLRAARFAAPRTLMLDGVDETVARDYARALSRLREAGASVDEIDMPEFGEIATINGKGGFPAAEAYAWHRPLMEKGADLYDPRVLVRIRRGAQQTAADYIDLLAARADFIARVTARLADFDAFLAPTTPVVAPPVSAFETDDEFARLNLLLLRNPTAVNLLDGASISVPTHEAGSPPTGLMISGPALSDRKIFALAGAIERALGR